MNSRICTKLIEQSWWRRIARFLWSNQEQVEIWMLLLQHMPSRTQFNKSFRPCQTTYKSNHGGIGRNTISTPSLASLRDSESIGIEHCLRIDAVTAPLQGNVNFSWR
mgnify:CR=1 FL=1